MIRTALLTFAAVAATPASAQPAASPAAVDYSKDANWLCLPGRSDICSTPLPTTALNSNGYGSVGRSEVAKDAAVDCFYVYPTVSNDRGLNSDLTVDNSERSATQVQFARFAGVCRTFAPVYRQMTLGAVAAAAAGADVTKSAMLAYADVASAWRTYLRQYNEGRPFVLIGHSQGSLMLQPTHAAAFTRLQEERVPASAPVRKSRIQEVGLGGPRQKPGQGKALSIQRKPVPHSVLPAASTKGRRRLMRERNCLGYRDCSPSDSARAGSGWTSRRIPSAPQAAAA